MTNYRIAERKNGKFYIEYDAGIDWITAWDYGDCIYDTFEEAKKAIERLIQKKQDSNKCFNEVVKIHYEIKI
jgi:hypothetical protein